MTFLPTSASFGTGSKRRLVGLVVQRPRQLGEGDLVAEGGEVDERLHVAQRRARGSPARAAPSHPPCRRRRCRYPRSPPGCRSSPRPPSRRPSPGSSTAPPRSSPGSRAPAPAASSPPAIAGFSVARSVAASFMCGSTCAVHISATPAPPPWLAAACLRGELGRVGVLDELAARRRRRCEERGEKERRTHGLVSGGAGGSSDGPRPPEAQLVSAKVSSLPALSALISSQSISCFSSWPVEPVLRNLSACSTASCACR